MMALAFIVSLNLNTSNNQKNSGAIPMSVDNEKIIQLEIAQKGNKEKEERGEEKVCD
jgi:hypothetical protein